MQLNIFQGKFLESVIDFVRKNNIDILQFQEVTGGQLSRGGVNQYLHIKSTPKSINSDAIGVDCFEKIKSDLGYDGQISINFRIAGDLNSYLGNAIFYKNCELIKTQEIWLKNYQEYANPEAWDPVTTPRSCLSLQLKKQGKLINFLNTHLAWGPTPEDEPYKLDQAKILFDYVKTLNSSFIFSGDFNLNPHSQVISWFNRIGKNLTEEHAIANTLNANVHIVEKLFPPGIAVDYVFTSHDIKVKSFRLVDDVDLSDHYGLLLEIEI